MAESKSTSEQAQASKQTGQAVARPDRPRQGVERWQGTSLSPFGNAFDLMDRMTEEMDQVFDRMFRSFGLPRRSSWLSRPSSALGGTTVWAPRVEAFQQGDRFIVRADLPGLKKDDVQVELRDDALAIHGERRVEHEQEQEGYYHSEREYGQFYRTIPLPEGVIAESAQASFRDGVLEVTMQAAPSEANRGRKLEIKDAPESGGSRK